MITGHVLSVLALLVCLIGAGCVSDKVLPPVRPAAYMFPTVDSARRLDACHACPVAAADVHDVLDEMNLLDLLFKCGMLESDVQLLARGLATRGYAELDARRSNAPVRWISFVCEAPPEIIATAAFSRMPPAEMLGGMSPSISQPVSMEYLVRTPSGFEKMTEDCWESGSRQLVRIRHADGSVSLWKLVFTYRLEKDVNE